MLRDESSIFLREVRDKMQVTLYCADSGRSFPECEFARSTTEFYTSLDQRGFKRHKLKTGVIVSGICLRKEEL